MRQGLVLGVCLLAGACWMPVQSQMSASLPDPTRPPANLSTGGRSDAASMTPGGGASAAARPAPGASGASAQVARPRLTLIRLDAQGRGVALIDGRLLSVGDRVGDAVVASIDAQGVVLRGAKGWLRLPLIAPSAPHKVVTPGVAAPAREEKESP